MNAALSALEKEGQGRRRWGLKGRFYTGSVKGWKSVLCGFEGLEFRVACSGIRVGCRFHGSAQGAGFEGLRSLESWSMSCSCSSFPPSS